MGDGGKSGGAGQTYNYYGTLAGGVNLGPNEDLVAIIINGQEVWPQGTPWALGINCTAGTLYVFDAQTWTCTANHVATNANAPGSGLEGWTEYTFARTTEAYDDFSLTASDGTYYGVMRFYWGTTTQTVDDLLQSASNDGGVSGNLGNGDQHPDYEGLGYVVVRDFLLGQEVQSGPNIEIVTRRKPKQAVISGADAGITDGQANLAAVAVELLTDENCLALPAAMIDATSFQAVADWLQTNQALYGASVLVDSSETVTSLFEKLVQMFDGYIRFNPATKKIELGVYPHGQIPVSYVRLTADSFTKFPKFNTKSWQETISRATVRYNSRQLNYQQTSVSVDDPRATFVLSGVREQSLDRPWITRPAQAMQHGTETLRVIGHAQMTGELEVRREIGRNIRAGDYVLVDIDLEPNTYSLLQFFRVTQRKLPPTGPITLSVFADNTLAPVPWNGSATPVMISQPAVPPITSFRYLEVPTVLSGSRGMIICLAQRPSNLLVGANLYFDTDPAGTFSSLGILSNFAALGRLVAPVLATDATLQVKVNMRQVDAEYFTQQQSANQQQNDTMLAVLVAVDPALTGVGGDIIGGVGGDVVAGSNSLQIAENGGFQIVEICSVGAPTLAAAGVYNLPVLRGRKNTTAAAFDSANTEVWLIPASLLTFFTHQLFDQLRANRLIGARPAYAQFRLCPYTFVNSLPLSSAATFAFQFPLKSASAPTLTLTAPLSYVVVSASTSLPFNVLIAGTWSDPDGNLVELKVLVRKSTDTADRLVVDSSFPTTNSRRFSTTVCLDSAGTWTVKLIARDATNLVTERDVVITLTSSAGAGFVAVPQIFDCNGDEILDYTGSPRIFSNSDIWGVSIDNPVGIRWVIQPGQAIPYGPISIRCQTPGALIEFTTTGKHFVNNELTNVVGSQWYSDNMQPYFMPSSNSDRVYLVTWAWPPGSASNPSSVLVLLNWQV